MTTRQLIGYTTASRNLFDFELLGLSLASAGAFWPFLIQCKDGSQH